ncbi:hypothetical protein AXF42_Ash015957 [Apostasia shenzhenica]|uniref:Uncharacterized protein n=1 Tax=Apostasia shenzhenica TaxID=1088818 RepID=A0A2I0AWJ1_9ASPA|nr:hypothetical protein AXF42_Ash015957 [Apostasia shenzhenica]
MEGLIPFVIHAIKKNRQQSMYRCLSDGSRCGGSVRAPMISNEGSSHHRRTRSEFPPATSAADGDENFAEWRNRRACDPSVVP